jgi:5-deoxy-glucuronate isomerase
MLQEFGYPQFDANGVKVLTRMDGLCSNMLQNITVYKLQAGHKRTFHFENQEMAIVLVEGDAIFYWDNQAAAAGRADFLADGAYCLHAPSGMTVKVEARGPSELLVQSTTNERRFEARLHTPENCQQSVFGDSQFEGKARRTVRTFFDYSSAPWSNMVCGEIIIPQGGWSSYPPHHHPQPEVYYYRFAKPQGFGACFIGDTAHVIRDGSFAAVPGGLAHPQVNAPGYPMYYVWMIRHFDNSPWTDRVFEPAHAWLLETS